MGLPVRGSAVVRCMRMVVVMSAGWGMTRSSGMGPIGVGGRSNGYSTGKTVGLALRGSVRTDGMFVWYGLKREYLRSSTSLERYGSGCRTGIGCAVAVGTAGYVFCVVAGV